MPPVFVVATERQRSSAVPNVERCIVRMTGLVGQGVNANRMNVAVVSIRRVSVVTGVRVRRFAKGWANAKKLWMGVIHVIRALRIVVVQSV